MDEGSTGRIRRWAWVAAGVTALLAGGLSLAVAAPFRAPAGPCAKNPAGRRVLESFCLSCHTLDAQQNPLRPRLDRARFGTVATARDSIGRLDQLNPAMILEFSGTDEERDALAQCLSSLARR
jgi:mono/diheme cytochrome c family protein